MTSDGRVVTERVEAASSAEAAETLRARGMTVLRLDAARADEPGGKSPVRKRGSGGTKARDLVLFTRQLKMLLEAGSSVVPALEAIEQQTQRE